MNHAVIDTAAQELSRAYAQRGLDRLMSETREGATIIGADIMVYGDHASICFEVTWDGLASPILLHTYIFFSPTHPKLNQFKEA